MTEPVKQTVNGWDGWPDDVRERLREWNRRYLLSFRCTGSFHCGGCDRRIQGHQFGNAVIRARRKDPGHLRCEDCLVALARKHGWPPELDPRRAAFRSLLEQHRKLQRRYELLDAHHRRLHEQVLLDDAYIDELEKRHTAEQVRNARAAVRQHPLHPRREENL